MVLDQTSQMESEPNASHETVHTQVPSSEEASAPRRSSRLSQPPARLSYSVVGTPDNDDIVNTSYIINY